jgi:hypothetical protein
MVITMNAAVTTNNAKQNSSIKEESVASLKDAVDRLRPEPKTWENRYLVLVAVTLFVGLLMLASQKMQSRAASALEAAQSKLSTEQERLSAAREVEVAQDLKDKDLKIEEAKASAAAAHERTAKLETEAADARLKTQELELTTEQLRQENSVAAARLEEEKRKRIGLAVSLLPREFMDQSGAIVALKGINGIAANIAYLDESEPREIAEQIHYVLFDCGWKVVGTPLRVSAADGIGVTVGRGPYPRDGGWEVSQEYSGNMRFTARAADALISELVKSGVEAHLAPGPSSIPPRTLLIRIGRKPNEALRSALGELGEPEIASTPLNGMRLRGNRRQFQ